MSDDHSDDSERLFTQSEVDALLAKENAIAKRRAKREFQAQLDDLESLRTQNQQLVASLAEALGWQKQTNEDDTK